MLNRRARSNSCNPADTEAVASVALSTVGNISTARRDASASKRVATRRNERQVHYQSNLSLSKIESVCTAKRRAYRNHGGHHELFRYAAQKKGNANISIGTLIKHINKHPNAGGSLKYERRLGTIAGRN